MLGQWKPQIPVAKPFEVYLIYAKSVDVSGGFFTFY